MASSYRCGPLNKLFGVNSTPSRTCGPLGINDQGDPNISCLAGDTPSPLGIFDYADPIPNYGLTNIGLGFLQKSPCGLTISKRNYLLDESFIHSKPNFKGEITLALAQEMALKITTEFEGGKSMNYQALAGDFDGQGTSFGLIQWNFGQNTLGPLLNKMRNTNPLEFEKCFHSESNFSVLKEALAKNNQQTQITWARNLQKTNITAWRSSFKNLGANLEFNNIQKKEAAAHYHPLVIAAIDKLRKIKPELMEKIEFRSYTALFDLCVQQSSINKAIVPIKTRISQEKPKSQRELIHIVVVERGKKASSDWASDCISRRLGILNGIAYSSTENKITKKRLNSQYTLIQQYGEHHVSPL